MKIQWMDKLWFTLFSDKVIWRFPGTGVPLVIIHLYPFIEINHPAIFRYPIFFSPHQLLKQSPRMLKLRSIGVVQVVAPICDGWEKNTGICIIPHHHFYGWHKPITLW